MGVLGGFANVCDEVCVWGGGGGGGGGGGYTCGCINVCEGRGSVMNA